MQQKIDHEKQIRDATKPKTKQMYGCAGEFFEGRAFLVTFFAEKKVTRIDYSGK